MEMKRGLILALFAFILSLSFVSAAPNLDITKTPINKIVVRGLSMPAIYDLTIRNYGKVDFFRIDTLLDVMIYPKDSIQIGGEKTIRINIYPKSEKDKYYGDWSFRYFISGEDSGVMEDNIMIKILNLADIIGIEVPTSINAKDKTFTIKLENKENITLNLSMTVDSTLISHSENFMFSPFEKKDIVIDTDSQKLALEAGNYNLKISFLANNEAELPITRDLILESDSRTELEVTKKSSTFIDQTTFVKKNVGNTVVVGTITANRTLLESMITSMSLKPDRVNREAGNYIYNWDRRMNPGDTYTVVMKTNYAWPWILLIIIIVCYLIVRKLTVKQIVLKKKAYRVKTKSGQFAAKIILIMKNKGKEVSNAKIIENIPPFTELIQDRFGTIKPAEIKKHSIVWDLPFIAAKEELILSYMVFSKVSILGKIEVAPAIATYQAGKGIMKESKSNSIFILTEEKRPEQAETIK
jgi:hypothetical protein